MSVLQGIGFLIGGFVVAAVIGACFGLALIVTGRGSGKTALPFGTFQALAVILWLYSPEVVRAAIVP